MAIPETKRIIVLYSGSITELNGAYGPILSPFICDINLIGAMVNTNKRVYQILSTGERILLTPDNFNYDFEEYGIPVDPITVVKAPTFGQHIRENIDSEEGIHNELRFFDGRFEYFNNLVGDWEELLDLGAFENLDDMYVNEQELVDAVALLATKIELADEVALLATKIELADAAALLATKIELADEVALLATKIELADAAALLATKIELADEVALLATKIELADEVALLATKIELSDEVALLATKIELSDAVALLATKIELSDAVALLATKIELSDEVALLATKIELSDHTSTYHAQKNSVTFDGDDLMTEYTFEHGLNTLDVVFSVYGSSLSYTPEIIDVDNIKLTFSGAVPSSDTIKIVVMG